MSKGTKIILGFVIAFVLTIVIIVGYVISAKFTAETHEQGIIAIDKNMQNVHSSVNKILKTSGITVKNFGETKLKAIEAGIKRYADKPNLMMQWIKENPQQIESTLWEKFQVQAEKQYTKFENEQKMKISMAQAYNTYLKASIKGTIASAVFSYPTDSVKAIMDRVIKTGDTAKTWETGVDEVVDVGL